jgi:probable addiction module antidote protein
MASRTLPWDPAEHLQSDEDRLAYLNAALEEAGDDPTFIAQVLGDIARSRGIEKVANEVGMSRQGLYKALSAEGNPELSTLLKVLRALGLRLHAEYATPAH